MDAVHIFVLIDALGWRYLEQARFLEDILPHRTPLRTVLGYSSGAIPTILTGKTPAETGHWNLFYYDPVNSPFRWLRYLSFFPDRVMEHRITRKLLKEIGRHLLGLGPLFECCVSPRLLPWFNYVEKHNLYGPGGIEGLSSIFDELERQGIPYRAYSYHRYSDAEILRRARLDVEEGEVRFFFIYLSEMDIFLHHHCSDLDAIERRLEWYAHGLRQIAAIADKVAGETTVAVFSDHGMTPVTQHSDVVGAIESLGFRMPEDYLAVYDSTMARFWFFNAEAKERTVERLQALSCGRILSEQEQYQLGVFFPDRRYGEVLFLLHPGWLMARSDFSSRWLPMGMHGYHPDDSYSDAVFLSNREPVAPMRTIADIYQCMRMALDQIAGEPQDRQVAVGKAGD